MTYSLVCFGSPSEASRLARRVLSLIGARVREVKYRVLVRHLRSQVAEVVRLILDSSLAYSVAVRHVEQGFTRLQLVGNALHQLAPRLAGYTVHLILDHGSVEGPEGRATILLHDMLRRLGLRGPRPRFRSSHREAGIQLADVVAGYYREHHHDSSCVGDAGEPC